MKKILMFVIVLLVIVFITGPASAWRVGVYRPHVHYWGGIGPGVVWAPPFYWVPPIYFGAYFPPYGYYVPGDDHPWVWVPGHWEERQTPEGSSEKVWIPGHWKYKP